MSARRSYRLAPGLVFATIAILSSAVGQTAQQVQNRWLTVRVRPSDGSFELRAEGLRDPVLTARVGVEINHAWILSTDYASHQVGETSFNGPLGSGHQVQVSFATQGKPGLKYVLQTYDDLPFGNIRVEVENTGQESFSVQSIRTLDAIGDPRVNLQGSENSERVLSDSYSEDRPPLHIFDLGKAPEYLGEDDFGKDVGKVHLGVGSQLIYNQQSKYSLLLAALTSDRLLTTLRLHSVHNKSGDVRVSSYTVESTGTTEIMKKESLRDDPTSDQIELSLPVASGKQISSETLAFSVSQDYHAQLETYGEMIRILHHARIPDSAPWGWWSWTAYYFGLSQATALSNAEWLSQHFKNYGFDFFHVDEGYAYDDGEFMTPNATRFPNGIGFLGSHICRLGMKFGMWVAPFRVGQKAWVYETHPEWLVHDAQGKPIQIGFIESSKDPIYVLDVTHPGAEEYLRRTFEKLSRQWGARYFKLDFMDDTAIEGYRHQPDVTALEAERMGVKIIRDAVGDDVLLDKDGSPMLNTVGLTDLGRTSTDTGHSFEGAKEDATGIAARYYMNNNFYVADPDAFTVAKQLITDQTWHQSKEPLSLDEAEVSISLAAIAGGMFEIGDDLPTLGSDPERVALVQNNDLLNMVKLKRAARPLDLMTYSAPDEQPSVLLLREDKRQAMLVVFNWTEGLRSHEFKLDDLGLSPQSRFAASNVFHSDRPVELTGGVLRIENQPPHSVRLIKLVDSSMPPSAPSVRVEGPARAQIGASVHFSSIVDPRGVPALTYHWDFGDGVSADGPSTEHAYTRNGNYNVTLKVEGLEGVAATETASIAIQGEIKTTYDIENSRRYAEH